MMRYWVWCTSLSRKDRTSFRHVHPTIPGMKELIVQLLKTVVIHKAKAFKCHFNYVRKHKTVQQRGVRHWVKVWVVGVGCRYWL
jgi:hypothetical protein